MGQLIPIELEDGTIIHIKATETAPSPSIGQPQFSDPNNLIKGFQGQQYQSIADTASSVKRFCYLRTETES